GQNLAIGSGGTLKLDHGGVTVAAVGGLDASGKVLEIAQSATISGVQSVTNGTLRIDGGAVLTDSSGISLSGGTITGAGTIASTVSASGVAAIAASGGTLEVTGAIGDSGSLALIATGAGDKLLLDASSAAASLTFNGSTGTLELAGSGTLTLASALSI